MPPAAYLTMPRTDRVLPRMGNYPFQVNQSRSVASKKMRYIYDSISIFEFKLPAKKWRCPQHRLHSPAWTLHRFAGGFCHQSNHRIIVLAMGFA